MPDQITIPDKLNFTPLQMKLHEIIALSWGNPEIKAKCMELVTLMEKASEDADKWRSLMFTIANQIN